MSERPNGEHLMKFLGRRPVPDSRDFLMRAALPRKLEPIPSSFYRWAGPVLDQGQVNCPLATTSHPFCREHGFCVGAGTRQSLYTSPIKVLGGPDLLTIYHRAQDLDEWPGGSESYAGTSVRAGCKVMVQDGYISEYHRAGSPQEVQSWLAGHGSVLIGIDWTESMFYPKENGLVVPDSNVVGGHCILIVGYNLKTQLYTMVNSWGKGWGVKGRFRMRFSDLHAMLFDSNGECWGFTEQRKMAS